MATIAGFTIESTIKQLDGKTVVSGYANTLVGGYDFAIARYHENGILDNSFSGDGKTTTDFFKSIDKAYSVIQQFDGKLVVAGYAYNNKIPPDSDFAVSRYNSDGTLDLGFSEDGKLTTDFFGSYDEGYSVIQQFDGKLVVAGYAYNKNGSRDFALARYKTDGTLDTSFSGDGKVTTDFGSTIDGAQSIIQQDDGKLLVAGYSGIGSPVNWIFAIARYKTDGSLDTSFSNDGKLTADFGSYGKYSITQESDGKFTVKGDGTLLAQYTPNGLLYYAPTGNVTISGTTTQGQILTAAHTLADVDGLGTVSYQWKANGSAITGATSTTYTLGQGDVGKTISVTASYTDGQGTTEAVTSSATTAVANVNDTPTGAVTLTGTATQGQTLTAANTLADVDGLGTVSYQWKANGSAITGATGTTYTLGQAEVGKTISVTASYTDGQGTTEAVTSSATTAVANVNDAPTGTVTLTGTATQGQTLTAANTLADADGLGTVTYQWKANGSAITGATGSTYTLGQAEVGKTISVTASYTDGQGTTEAVTSAATTAVSGAYNTPTGSVTIVGAAKQGWMLIATNTLADVDGLGSISYQWNADSVAISGATASSFVLTSVQIGKAVSVTASYTDGSGTTESITSIATAVVVGNDTPDVFDSGSVFVNDQLYGGNGDDTLYGGNGDDSLYGEADNDKLYGDAGADTLSGGAGNDTLDGGAGNDSMEGGTGNDTYYVRQAGDKVTELAAAGADTVWSYLAAHTLAANVEKGMVKATGAANLTGNALANTLTGNASNNVLNGGAGKDTLVGGAGNDTLVGGAAQDKLTGGTGNDVFKFNTLAESGIANTTRDVITDFVLDQDKIDLSTIDANTALAGNQAFTGLIGANVAFTKAGQLRLNAGVLYGNTDADAAAEFSIALTGITTLANTDFVL